MSWLQKAIQLLKFRSKRAERQEWERLPSVLAHVSEQANREEGFRAARKLSDLLKRTFGRRNPEYARGLSGLALLAMARGEVDEAESLLVRALTIRRGMLGPFHPETIETQERLEALRQGLIGPKYATTSTTLSDESIEGLDPPVDGDDSSATTPAYLEKPIEAGPASAAADAGATTVASESEPEAALEERIFEIAKLAKPGPEAVSRSHRTASIQATPLHSSYIVKALPSEGLDPVPGVAKLAEGLADELATLSQEFSRLGTKLSKAASKIVSRGQIPPEGLVEPLAAARREFERRRSRLRQIADELHVACPSDEDLAGLDDLSKWLEALRESERRQSEARLTRSRAMETLSRILSLSYFEPLNFAPLLAMQERARALRETIADGKSAEPCSEAASLAKGNHPFNDLLMLVRGRKVIKDAEWGHLHDSLARQFGPELAAAAARGRLKSKSKPQGFQSGSFGSSQALQR